LIEKYFQCFGFAIQPDIDQAAAEIIQDYGQVAVAFFTDISSTTKDSIRNL
jgi:hypothetical protein